MKKFELTDETMKLGPITLHRVKALVAFADVEAGDIGGWVEGEGNLEHKGNAWVSGDARVSGNACVYGDARVSGNACVYGDARVSGDARVYGNAWVSGNARVSGNACVYGDARVSGNACVYGDAWVSGNACVYGDAWVSGNACVYGDARVSGDARVYGNACVSGDARVSGNARVYGDACVSGNAWVYGKDHHLVIGPIGSRNDTITFTRDKRGGIFAKVGCFFGTLAEFRAKVGKTHGENIHAQAYLMAAQLAELRIDTTPIADTQEEPTEGFEEVAAT